MKSVFTALTTLMLWLTLFTSCTQQELYFKYNKIENSNWYRDSLLNFTIDTIKVEQRGNYNLLLELTTTALYPYRDIHLRIHHNLTDTIFDSDTIQYNVADEYGRWLGTGVGSLRQLSLPYKSDVFIDTLRSYQIRITHILNDDPLKGVEKVGLRIIKTANS